MTGVTTGQTALPTATDSDDVESYNTGPSGLVLALQMLANLFDSVTGHAHSGAGQGKPITNAGIAAGAVDSAQLALNSVTQDGFVQVSAQSTASTSYVDTGLDLTLTTTGGHVLLMGHVNFSNTGVNETSFALFEDGSNIDNFGQVTTPVANQNQRFSFVTRRNPAAGTHTWRVEWKVSAGTSTMTTGINSELTAVELKR